MTQKLNHVVPILTYIRRVALTHLKKTESVWLKFNHDSVIASAVDLRKRKGCLRPCILPQHILNLLLIVLRYHYLIDFWTLTICCLSPQKLFKIYLSSPSYPESVAGSSAATVTWTDPEFLPLLSIPAKRGLLEVLPPAPTNAGPAAGNSSAIVVGGTSEGLWLLAL